MNKQREWALNLKVGDIVCLVENDSIDYEDGAILDPGFYRVAQHWMSPKNVMHSSADGIVYVALSLLDGSLLQRAVPYTKLVPNDSKTVKVLYGRQ